jgi:hypothetical protein
MKTNILKLSALLTVLTLSSAVVVAERNSTQTPVYSGRMPHHEHHLMRELRHIFHYDNPARLKSFMGEHPNFVWNEAYPHLLHEKIVTPLTAAKHFKAKNCVSVLQNVNTAKTTGFMQGANTNSFNYVDAIMEDIDPFDYVETL